MAFAALEAIARRETIIVALALLILTLLAWLALLAGAGTAMDPFAMSGWLLPSGEPPGLSFNWSPAYWLVSFAMWSVMMVAMMLPSASPTVLLYARVVGHSGQQGRTRDGTASIAAFVAGYIAIWSLFSALAVIAQWALESARAMSAMMMLRSPAAAGALLIGVGLYQLSSLKERCLAHCRSPAHFIARHRRPGSMGAFRMGLEHGAYCVGCCAALMALLFAGGLMNLVWIAGLSAVVLAEKLLPRGASLRVPLGFTLLAGGAGLIAAQLLRA